MSPNADPTIHERTEVANKIAETLDRKFGETKIEAGVPYPVSRYNELASCERVDDIGRVCQSLRAVIRAGDEFISVVDILLTGSKELTMGLAVTRYKQGGRAELIGYIGEGQETIEIGRNPQREHNLSPTTSGDHMSITYDPEDQSVAILDRHSTNGTFVYGSKERDGVNPILDKNFWSQKSSDVREAFAAV
jgi:hypothetical protein